MTMNFAQSVDKMVMAIPVIQPQINQSSTVVPQAVNILGIISATDIVMNAMLSFPVTGESKSKCK